MIQRHIFDVEYDDPAAGVREYRTRVVMADRVATESRGKKYGLADPREQPQLTAFLWLWFSSVREGHISEDTTFEEFQTRCLENTKVESVDVPPTVATSASPSTSPGPSPESASTGSSGTTG